MPETGRWEGLPERGGMLPTAELDAEGWRQYHRFMSVVDKLASAVGADGRPAFAVPVDASSADPTFRNMDGVAMVRSVLEWRASQTNVRTKANDRCATFGCRANGWSARGLRQNLCCGL
jgi:hypothetical protein